MPSLIVLVGVCALCTLSTYTSERQVWHLSIFCIVSALRCMSWLLERLVRRSVSRMDVSD